MCMHMCNREPQRIYAYEYVFISVHIKISLSLQLPDLVTDRDLVTVLRYVGWTASSSDVQHLLHSLCEQLCRAVGYSSRHVPRDVQQLQRFFPQLLTSLPGCCTAVILLDDLHLVRRGECHGVRESGGGGWRERERGWGGREREREWGGRERERVT